MFKAQMDNLTAITSEMPQLSAAVTDLSNLNDKIEGYLIGITGEINGLKEIFEDLALKDAYRRQHKRKESLKREQRRKQALSEFDVKHFGGDNVPDLETQQKFE